MGELVELRRGNLGPLTSDPLVCMEAGGCSRPATRRIYVDGMRGTVFCEHHADREAFIGLLAAQQVTTRPLSEEG